MTKGDDLDKRLRSIAIDIGCLSDLPTKPQYRSMRNAICLLEDEIYEQVRKHTGPADQYTVTLPHDLCQKFRLAMYDETWRSAE